MGIIDDLAFATGQAQRGENRRGRRLAAIANQFGKVHKVSSSRPIRCTMIFAGWGHSTSYSSTAPTTWRTC